MEILPLKDIFWTSMLLVCCVSCAKISEIGSAVGDPGMRRDGLRVGFEAWNFCNQVGKEAPSMGSPRAADCFDLSKKTLYHRVSDADNKLGTGKQLPGLSKKALHNADLYAAEKEKYLGSLCEVKDTSKPWQFWMIMLKNGNYDTNSGLCPKNGKKVAPFNSRKFPCPGNDCMNQPLLYHERTNLSGDGSTMRGGFHGSYELDPLRSGGVNNGISYYEVVWEKNVGSGSWVFSHKLKTSKLYPWLMLYLRADATKGFSGGYHYDTRGMLKTLPESPNFKVRLTLDVKQGGGPKSQFYLIDIGSCWKNDGNPCNGDTHTDITRYSEMIINPATQAWCSPETLVNCPPFHITPNNKKIYRNDTNNFPYGAYHYYCAPGNAKHLEAPYSICDPYSNPQAQELVQLLPHPIWAEYGYPTKPGDGWIGDSRTWELDVGGLSSRLYFYQDPGTTSAKRIWTSIDVGAEIFVSNKDEVAEWTISDFDVIITSSSI
ncbi:Calcium and calcium/calmodulin-dependent serine/threonine-protein kinase [Heracleum sosnowskyi]|uniref:Calcium and calcium/calmodulin-dependent serine/threonine-protein kinase n=1 Tax=Heracleum sosnowskyi TaxID=360622 RepID=A0AAD8J6M1_9APIA|nr:Calcium and calcium/calmodulin-dependent serine/threonine-protein kinase [Heracleum sosnowskyi]